MRTPARVGAARPWRRWAAGRRPGDIPLFRNEKRWAWCANTFSLPVGTALRLFSVAAPWVPVNEAWLEYGRRVLDVGETSLREWYRQAWWGHHAALACRDRLVTPGREHEVVALAEPVDWGPLEAATSLGKGVILATPHWGVPKLVSVLLAMMGRPVMRLGFWRGYRYPIWGSNTRQDRTGYTSLYLQCFSALRRGGIVAGAPDGPVWREAVKARFFGRPCETSLAVAALARLSRAPTLPCIALWHGARVRVAFGASLEPPREEGGAAADAAWMRQYLDWLEDVVRRNPRAVRFDQLLPRVDTSPVACGVAG